MLRWACASYAQRDIGPWFKPQNLDTFFVLANFHFDTSLAISTYGKPNI